MKKYRDHMCFACFKRCSDPKCDANHRCTNCGGDYIYFCDNEAKEGFKKFLKWKKAFDAKRVSENKDAKKRAARNAARRKARKKNKYVKPKRNARA